jgi:hypothetical protein
MTGIMDTQVFTSGPTKKPNAMVVSRSVLEIDGMVCHPSEKRSSMATSLINIRN